MQKQNLTHIIIRLAPGGTEYKLLNLVRDTKETFQHTIIVLTYAEISIRKELEINKIKLIELNIIDLRSFIKSLSELKKLFKSIKVDLIISWLYHSNFFAFIFKYIVSSKATIVWNIRSSMSSFRGAPFHRKIVIYISKFLSSKVAAIVYNSEMSLKEHMDYGFINAHAIVINNGVDTNKFKPIVDAKRKLCEELDADPNTFLIGICARFHPVKNHSLLIKSVRELLNLGFEVNCLMCGSEMNGENTEITKEIGLDGMKKNFFLLDHRKDLPLIYSALDVHILTSLSESSSNSVMESLSCGTICLSTDVGNSSELLEDQYIFKSNDMQALINALSLLINNTDKNTSYSDDLRRNIESKFSIEKMNKEYIDFYKGIIN